MSATRDLQISKLFSVAGQVCLVTGGGSGIGLMAAQALAANGARVYIVGRTERKLDAVVQHHGRGIAGSIVPLPGDITNKDEIRRLYTELERREGRLDVLINNAGRWSNSQEARGEGAEEVKQNLFEPENATFEDWGSMFRINAGQIYFMTTAFLPLLQKAAESPTGISSPAVVNMTSVSGIIKSSEDHFATNASKAGAIHLTKLLTAEVARLRLNIRINSIAPGVFPSEITAGGSGEDQKSQLPQGMLKNISAKRPGNERDMASAVLFAVTNEYLNGQIVVVDGGYLLEKGAI